jgi:hypothetical protein
LFGVVLVARQRLQQQSGIFHCYDNIIPGTNKWKIWWVDFSIRYNWMTFGKNHQNDHLITVGLVKKNRKNRIFYVKNGYCYGKVR